ncbi:hypothetical protein T06_10922 [Trichinella sp. T6]|nr:hypothetical protein T06_10922 [Trichinella sp. T6]
MEVLADEGDPCVGLCLLVISFGMFRCSNFSETKKCLSSSSTCNSDQLSLHVEYEEEMVYYKISMQAEKLELSFSKAAETADTFWVELQLQACSVQERRDTWCHFNIPWHVLQTCDICKCLWNYTAFYVSTITTSQNLNNSMLQHFYILLCSYAYCNDIFVVLGWDGPAGRRMESRIFSASFICSDFPYLLTNYVIFIPIIYPVKCYANETIKLNSCYFAHYYIIEFTLRGAERKIVLLEEHN